MNQALSFSSPPAESMELEFLWTWADSIVFGHGRYIWKLYSSELSKADLTIYHEIHRMASERIWISRISVPGNFSWSWRRIKWIDVRVLPLSPDMIHDIPDDIRNSYALATGYPSIANRRIMSVVPRISGKHLWYFFVSEAWVSYIRDEVSQLLTDMDIPVLGIGDNEWSVLDPTNIKVLQSPCNEKLSVVVTDIWASIQGTIAQWNLLMH